MVGRIQEPARIRLELRSRADGVALVRAALGGLGTAAGLDEELVMDLKTAASEACNNVVQHAYGDLGGPMTVEAEVLHGGVAVTVADTGTGITRISSGEDHMGLGIAVISALAKRAEFDSSDGGTAVRMWFEAPTSVAASRGAGTETEHAWRTEPSMELAGDLVARFAPVSVLRFVLGHIARTVAASVHFSVLKVSELHALNDALAAYVELAAGDEVRVIVSSDTRRLSLTGGPYPPAVGADGDGAAARAAELEQRRQELTRLFDGLSIEAGDQGELIHLEVLDRSR